MSGTLIQTCLRGDMLQVAVRPNRAGINTVVAKQSVSFFLLLTLLSITILSSALGQPFPITIVTPESVSVSREYANCVLIQGDELNYTYTGGTCHAMVGCADGGYALAGESDELGWLVRTNAMGDHQWNEGFGPGVWRSVIERSNGSLIIAGYTSFLGSNDSNVWLVHLDADGQYVWDKEFGGNESDLGYSVIECNSGGFAITGSTSSFGAEKSDMWLIRTDSNGNHLWNITYDNLDDDVGVSLVECMDGGFVIAGNSLRPTLEENVWLVRTNETGNIIWHRSYPASGYDHISQVIECTSGGFALVGKSAHNMWLIRTNLNGDIQWDFTYGGWNHDEGFSVVECHDGGFAITGYTLSYGTDNKADLWLVRTNIGGDLLWNRTYGSQAPEWGSAILEHPSGGFVIAGTIGISVRDQFWLLWAPDEAPPLPPPPGIPYELVIMVAGYIVYAQLVILLFILIHRKFKILTPQNPHYIIILAGIFSIVCHLIGHFLGVYCYFRSVGGRMCSWAINERVIIFWILRDLCLITTIMGLVFALFFIIKSKRIDAKESK